MKKILPQLFLVFSFSLFIQASELLVLAPDDRVRATFDGEGYIETAGYEFTVGESFLLVSALGVRAHDDWLVNMHTVGLWDSNRNLIASTTVSPGVGTNGFRFAVLNSPVLLNRHQTYVVGSTYAHRDADQIGLSRVFEDASPIYNSAITFDLVRFDSLTNLTFPSNTGSPAELGMFGPNLLFDKTMALEWITIAPGARVISTASAPNGDLIVAGTIAEHASLEQQRLRGKRFPQETVFVAKLSSTGKLLFAKKVGANVFPTSIASDTKGNVVVAFQVLDRIPARYPSKVGSKKFRQTPDAWLAAVAMFNPKGSLAWVKPFPCFIHAIVGDQAGNYVFAGSIQASNRIGNGIPVGNGMSDAVVAKLDARGNVSWVARGGGPGDDGIEALAVATNGNVFVTGYMVKPEGANPGLFTATFGTRNLPFDGFSDAFFVEYSASGSVVDAFATGAWAAYPIALSLSGTNLTVIGGGDALHRTNNPVTPYFLADVNFVAGRLERGIQLTNKSIESSLILPNGDLVVVTGGASTGPRSLEKISRSGVLLSSILIIGTDDLLSLASGPDQTFYFSGGMFGDFAIGATNIVDEGFASFMTKVIE